MSEVRTLLVWGVADGDGEFDTLYQLDELYDAYPDDLVRGDSFVGAEVADLDGLYDVADMFRKLADELAEARARSGRRSAPPASPPTASTPAWER